MRDGHEGRVDPAHRDASIGVRTVARGACGCQRRALQSPHALPSPSRPARNSRRRHRGGRPRGARGRARRDVQSGDGARAPAALPGMPPARRQRTLRDDQVRARLPPAREDPRGGGEAAHAAVEGGPRLWRSRRRALDLVLRPEQPFTVPARAGDIYRCFSVATSFAEDRYFTAAEVVPGNSKIVHHVLAMVDPSGQSARLTSRDGLDGYPCFGGPGVRIDGYLGGWAPGARPWLLPEGVGMLLPKGARVVFQLHYHNPRPAVETDHTELRLRLATGPVQKRLQFMRVDQFSLTIPAGAARHEIEAESFVHRPINLIAIHPHMHLLGREMKVWARMRDESVKPLIHIDDWDFNWQGFYWYRTPVTLPAGSWIELSAAWDNSEKNSRNPNHPPRDVHWGERTIDEMGHAAILYTFDDEKIQ